MEQSNTQVRASHPVWDGRRILFQLEAKGQCAPCAISLGALQDLGKQRSFKSADFLKNFSAAHHHIAAVALAKLERRLPGTNGLLNLWADDFDDVPPATPVVMSRPKDRKNECS